MSPTILKTTSYLLVQKTDDCHTLLKQGAELTCQLVASLVEKKFEGLATVLTFLGTNLALSKFPHGKLDNLLSMINAFLAKRNMMLHKSQVLLGHLNHLQGCCTL